MSSFVRALYDFTGEPGTTEITISAGEILSVTSTDVGEGWWEGQNLNGKIGLFPAAYVEVLSAAEASQQLNIAQISQAPPKNLTQNNNVNNIQPVNNSRYDATTDEYNDGADDWEDDWDDDNDTYSEIGPANSMSNDNNINKISTSYENQQQNQIHHQQSYQKSNYANINLPPTPTDDTISLSSVGNINSTATVKKSGIFSKSGDSYLLGMVTVSVPENEKVFINHVDNKYVWASNMQIYSVKVASPKKETKFKGMKTFIAYQLTPTFNNISVSRRYKHFDWLHERLVEKFCIIPIPPLPDKQISGRYEEQFIEHRRVQLQEFVDWVCRHPILSICDVWMHFLTCTDEKKWKTGKRAAERDTLVGILYCSTIFPPEKQLLPSYIDGQIDSCSLFVHAMDSSVKNLLTISSEQTKRLQYQSKKDFQRIGEGFSELARALEIDERRISTTTSLASSVGKAAGLFIAIGQMFGEQPKHDWIPFSDRLHIYRGILNSFPDILSTHKSCMQKRKECERLTVEQKMGNGQLAEVGRRTDIISYAVLAEMSHFRSERDVHLKNAIKNVIEAQIQFFQDVIAKLQNAQKQFQ